MIFCKLILEINSIYLFEWKREGFGEEKVLEKWRFWASEKLDDDLFDDFCLTENPLDLIFV